MNVSLSTTNILIVIGGFNVGKILTINILFFSSKFYRCVGSWFVDLVNHN